jgi:hypothetical protein
MVAAAPFIIFTMGRCRTAWLCRFLSYGEWECKHEYARHLRTIDDLRAALLARNTGYAETGAAPAWPLIRHLRPDIRVVIIRRSVGETAEAMIAAGRKVGVAYDESALFRVLAYNERCLSIISAHSGALTFDHQDLDQKNVCAQIFEYCLPYSFDADLWRRLRSENIQVDMMEFFVHYQKHRNQIEEFKKSCKRELIRLCRAGELNA